MYKYSFFILLFSIIQISSYAQKLNFDQVFDKKNIRVGKVIIDHLDHIYIIGNNNQELQKLDKDGKLLYAFNDYRFGDIAKIDVTNPFKILVYYQDFETILILDNTLSLIEEMALPELGYLDIENLCISNDNHIWIFEPASNQLHKINAQGIALVSSNDLQFELGHVPEVREIIEKYNELYVLEKNGDLHFFNVQGRYFKTRSISASFLFPFSNQIFFLDKKLNFKLLDPFLGNSSEIKLPEEMTQEKDIYYTKSRCIFWDSKGIRAYKLK